MNRPRPLFIALLVFAMSGVLFALGTIAYLAYVRAMASSLIKSAYDIRTKADAEREIAVWKKKMGIFFWTEGDHPGGDHSYDATVANLPVARLRIVEPTGLTVGITMRDGELRSVTVIESVGWYASRLCGFKNGSTRRCRIIFMYLAIVDHTWPQWNFHRHFLTRNVKKPLR